MENFQVENNRLLYLYKNKIIPKKVNNINENEKNSSIIYLHKNVNPNLANNKINKLHKFSNTQKTLLTSFLRKRPLIKKQAKIKSDISNNSLSQFNNNYNCLENKLNIRKKKNTTDSFLCELNNEINKNNDISHVKTININKKKNFKSQRFLSSPDINDEDIITPSDSIYFINNECDTTQSIIKITNSEFDSPKNENNSNSSSANISHQEETLSNSSKSLKIKPTLYHKNTKITQYDCKNYIPILSNYLFKSYSFIIRFLDDKSVVILSMINKKYHKIIKNIVCKKLYEKIAGKKSNKNFCMKVIHSIYKYSSKKLKVRSSINLTNKYNQYKFKSIYSENIIKDISRTFPNENYLKKNTKNYYKLYNILTSYSNFNKNIGYAQGLNFLCASSLFLFDTEEQIFLFLDCLINKFDLEDYYSIKNKNLSKKYRNFSFLLKKYCPGVINYFELKEINHDFFSIKWLLTLFSNSMKRKFLFKTWSFMIIFGWKFFICFIITLLNFYKKNIVKKSGNELRIYMAHILDDEQFCTNYNIIIQKTLDFMIENIIL